MRLRGKGPSVTSDWKGKALGDGSGWGRRNCHAEEGKHWVEPSDPTLIKTETSEYTLKYKLVYVLSLYGKRPLPGLGPDLVAALSIVSTRGGGGGGRGG